MQPVMMAAQIPENNTAASTALDENGLPTERSPAGRNPNNTGSAGHCHRPPTARDGGYGHGLREAVRRLHHATTTLDTFDKRWGLNPYTAEATYLRYQIALRRNNLKDAQRWSDKLQKDFSGTQWAAYVAPAPGEPTESGPAIASVGAYYDATYDLLQQRQYGEVLSRARTARRQYTMRLTAIVSA